MAQHIIHQHNYTKLIIVIPVIFESLLKEIHEHRGVSGGLNYLMRNQAIAERNTSKIADVFSFCHSWYNYGSCTLYVPSLLRFVTTDTETRLIKGQHIHMRKPSCE